VGEARFGIFNIDGKQISAKLFTASEVAGTLLVYVCL